MGVDRGFARDEPMITFAKPIPAILLRFHNPSVRHKRLVVMPTAMLSITTLHGEP